MTKQNENKRTSRNTRSTSRRPPAMQATPSMALPASGRRRNRTTKKTTGSGSLAKDHAAATLSPAPATPNLRKRRASALISDQASTNVASAPKRARASLAARKSAPVRVCSDDSSCEDYSESEEEGDRPPLIHEIEEGDGGGRKMKKSPSCQGILVSGSEVPVNEGTQIFVGKARWCRADLLSSLS